VEAVPVFIIAVLLAAVGGVLASLAIPSCDPSQASPSCGPWFVLVTLASEIGFVLAVVFWVRVVSHAPLAALGAPRRPLLDVATGFLGGLGLVAASWVAGILILLVARLILGHPPEPPEQVPDYVGGGSLVWSSLVVVLAAPIGEEVFFRGFLYRGLRGRLSMWPAAVISAVAFSLIHLDPILIFALAPVGVGLALIYEWRQTILASIVAHSTFNLVGITVIILTR
jgi:membrane protease YdiL (CAAX protease family)